MKAFEFDLGGHRRGLGASAQRQASQTECVYTHTGQGAPQHARAKHATTIKRVNVLHIVDCGYLSVQAGAVRELRDAGWDRRSTQTPDMGAVRLHT